MFCYFHCVNIQDHPDFMTSDLHLGDIMSRVNISRKGSNMGESYELCVHHIFLISLAEAVSVMLACDVSYLHSFN